MNHVDSIIHKAELQCKAHGARLTVKRKQVLAGLIQSKKALSAYELINFCKERYGEVIPAMSVYRILEFLKEENLVHKLNLANKYVVCAHISCDHAHATPQFLICQKCSKVKEISVKLATITELQQSVQEAGFKLTSPQLEMNCLCDDCLAQAA
ncbi:Fe2+/Zn2+ uptake regulation protein [Hahella chejuensis KCTC 2396]|uniref:Fe2+/Zn2+ uptake regulation protein n=1 Tax=Hahella chejuensis (strain KCTC 2396) TaxID=349521 RepID=Q2SLC3_HAHCH|nr:Fur family transcriptional regulator [Hahella chejuensis]ABC28551.1 Fe2+/Zn2+ uptake regulation protein [Hahella chejuensis KCTC 2396]